MKANFKTILISLFVFALVVTACAPQQPNTPQPNSNPIAPTSAAPSSPTPFAIQVSAKNGVAITTPLAEPAEIKAVPVPEPFPTLTLQLFDGVDVPAMLKDSSFPQHSNIQSGIFEAVYSTGLHYDDICPGANYNTARRIVNNALYPKSILSKAFQGTAMAFLDRVFKGMADGSITLEAFVISPDESTLGIWFDQSGRQVLVLIGNGLEQKLGMVVPADSNIITVYGQSLRSVVAGYLRDIVGYDIGSQMAPDNSQIFFTRAGIAALGGAIVGYTLLDNIDPGMMNFLMNFVKNWGACLSTALKSRPDYKSSDESRNPEYSLVSVNGQLAYTSQQDAVNAAKSLAIGAGITIIVIEVVGMATGNEWVLIIPLAPLIP